MNTSNIYSVGDARAAFADILNKVAYSGEVVTILKHGMPVVRVIPARSAATAEKITKYFGLWKSKAWAKSIGKPSRRMRKNRFTL